MDLVSKEELRSLLEYRNGPCVSIFLPTHRAGAETQQNPIRFKNLLRQAAHLLEKREMRTPEVEEFLRPARDLLDSTPFWQHQEDGLAVYLAADFFRHFRVPLKLDEKVVVESHCYLKPLLPLLYSDGKFYILALSQNAVKLYEARRHSIREMELRKAPHSLVEAVGSEVTGPHIQFHTGTATPRGDRPAIFHGHGGGEEDLKEELLRFFNLVDAGVQETLTDKTPPLVLAGVEYLFPIYREVNTYPNLATEGISGNPEDVSPEALRDRGWSIVEPQFRRDREEAAGRYHERVGTGHAGNSLAEIVPAAHDGRIDTLFVAVDTERWGTYDPQARKIHLAEEPGPQREDLLDLAAIQTLLHGGKVFGVPSREVPGGGEAAAIYRY